MKIKIEAEFYYRSSVPEHVRMLQLIETTLAPLQASVLLLRSVNLDDPAAVIPETVPGIPCLRRLAPVPERIILGPLKTPEDIHTALGLPPLVAPIDSDQFTSWKGLRS